MIKINSILDELEVDSKFIFDLKRRAGKKIYVNHGNEMVNANDKIHHIARSKIIAHIREIGGVYGKKFRQQTKMSKGEYVYSKNNPCHIVAVINPPSYRKMDAPNWYPTIKGLIDGMTDADIFTDDNDDVVKSITFIPGKRTRNGKYRIELNIIEGEKPFKFKQKTFDEILQEEYNKGEI